MAAAAARGGSGVAPLRDGGTLALPQQQQQQQHLPAAHYAEGAAAILQRCGSFTSRMTPLPKQEHQQQHQQQQHAPADAPRWRPRAQDQLPPPAPAAAEQLQHQKQPQDDDLLACGAAPFLSCCEALDFAGTGATPQAGAAAAAATPLAAPAAAAASLPLPHKQQQQDPVLSSASSPTACAAPDGAANEFNPEVVLQLR